VLHDQTVRLMSHGLKPAEIAEGLRLPEALATRWHARSYYGTVSHNVKAIYQHYLSWYDAHPANLHAHPPVAAAQRYVRYMGGVDALVAQAQLDLQAGDYRWVAEVMKHAVYAHPEHAAARDLAAQAHEQMGFQAESATWRNAFLLAAREYREGAPPPPVVPGGSAMLAALSNTLLFDALAVRLNAERAGALAGCIAIHFSDSGQHWRLEISNGALHPIQALQPDEPADVQLTLKRPVLDAILSRSLALPAALAQGQASVMGDTTLIARLFGVLDEFSGSFPVIDAAPWPV